MSESIMETNQAQAEQEPHRYEITPRPAHLGGACAELERLEIVTSHKIEDSTKGKPQLTLRLPADR